MRRNRQTGTQGSASSSAGRSRRPEISAPMLQSEYAYSSQFGHLEAVRDSSSAGTASRVGGSSATSQSPSPSQEKEASSSPPSAFGGRARDSRRHGMLQSPSATSGNAQAFRGSADRSDVSTEFEEDSSSCYSSSDDDTDQHRGTAFREGAKSRASMRRDSGSILIGVEAPMSRLGVHADSSASGSECSGTDSGEECSGSEEE
ncbi:hypothetical protein IAR50_003696 [Cryptococcus sp. DSM 104548]